MMSKAKMNQGFFTGKENRPWPFLVAWFGLPGAPRQGFPSERRMINHSGVHWRIWRGTILAGYVYHALALLLLCCYLLFYLYTYIYPHTYMYNIV